MKKIFVQYKITGYNLDRLINHLKRKGICLYDVKKIDVKTMFVSVKYNQSKNFFAITEELCYNIVKVKLKGRNYPLFYLYKNLGVLIGAILFIFIATYFNGFILDVKFTGTGSADKIQIEKTLEEYGVKKFSRFSKYDLSDLSALILRSNKNLSFVSCEKVGNVLRIESSLVKEQGSVLTGTAESLVCPIDGIIENLKVYRGSAMFDVGEFVKKGDVLVSNKVVYKEQEITVNVLAVATILANTWYYYESDVEQNESAVIGLAENSFDLGEIASTEVFVEQLEQKYIYKVKINYRQVVSVG